MLDKPLAKFMTLALTVVLIGALLFSKGYKLVDDQTDHYDDEIRSYQISQIGN